MASERRKNEAPTSETGTESTDRQPAARRPFHFLRFDVNQSGGNMTISTHYDQCLAFLNTEISPRTRAAEKADTHFRSVTLSREAGSGGNSVAENLVKNLQRTNRKGARPWTMFDRNLVDKVLEDHQLPTRLAKFFPEDRLTELQDIMDEVFGLRPGSWKLVQQTSETILHIAALGGAVIVGRAGNIVTRRLPDVLHVRLVGSLEVRVRRLSENRGMTRKSALDFIHREDVGRRRYVKKYFGEDVDNPLLYHLTLNTDLITIEEATDTITRVVQSGF
jgi:cytidylate kinase